MSTALVKQSVPQRIRTSLGDKAYRHSYAEEFLNTWIATQIKVLREKREWKQSDLARETGMKQSAISRLEDMNYSSWSISTLKRLAFAFDVRLKVSFETFGSLIREFREFSAESLGRADYAHDPVFTEALASIEPVATIPGPTSKEIRVFLDGLVLNPTLKLHSEDFASNFYANIGRQISSDIPVAEYWQKTRESIPAATTVQSIPQATIDEELDPAA